MMMAAAHLSNTKPEGANTVRVLFSMSYIQLPHIQNARISNAEGRKGTSGYPMLDITNFDNTVVGIVSAKDWLNHVQGPKISTVMINLINSFNARN